MKKIIFPILLLVNTILSADTWTPAIFNDNMVLQRGVKVPVWGKDTPGAEITVSFANQTAKTIANKEGKWKLFLKPMKAGEGGEMVINGSSRKYLKNVVVGDVWLCSGQSNMEMSVRYSRNSKEEIFNAKYPDIRFFQVKNETALQPREDLCGEWTECSPKTVPEFSAVGYFFAREIYQEKKIPLGLIQSDWGASSAESWTSLETLKSDSDFNSFVNKYKEFNNDPKPEDTYEKKLRNWKQKYGDGNLHKDSGNIGFNKGWARPECDLSGWKDMKLPCCWEKRGLNIDGAVWFRKDVNVSFDSAGKDLYLYLGPVDDFDVTYFNGEKIGQTGSETPSAWAVPRKYKIPGRFVKKGKNCIAIRVFDNFGDGGVGGEDGLFISADEHGDKVVEKLSGNWKFKVEYMLPPKPQLPNLFWVPSCLYNAMIAPLVQFPITGAIWYQGEANTDRAYQYRKLFPDMIKSWRKAWGYDFPFYFVQLANFQKVKLKPSDSSWAELREAQTMTLSLPNTGMAVTIDIGEANDVHPKNKQDVGKRLALNALAKVYGKKEMVYSGPIYESMNIKDNKIVIKFTHVGGGLWAKGGELKGFAIAGEDRNFVWADAVIKGNTVVVSNSEVMKPLAARYAWAGNPVCNLFSKEGLPASPFRTDNWPGITEDNF